MKKLNILFLMLMLAVNSFATNYYVAQNDPSASNTNPGTEALPFETIQAAADIATGGDTVFEKQVHIVKPLFRQIRVRPGPLLFFRCMEAIM
jgi:hypothetical protein